MHYVTVDVREFNTSICERCKKLVLYRTCTGPVRCGITVVRTSTIFLFFIQKESIMFFSNEKDF